METCFETFLLLTVVFWFCFAGRWSACCLSVFRFARVWAFGGCCRLRRFTARPGDGSSCHLSCAVWCVGAPPPRARAASCASGSSKSLCCTIVRQACAVHCASAVRVVTPTDAWWTHAFPEPFSEVRSRYLAFTKLFSRRCLKSTFGESEKLILKNFTPALIFIPKWARSKSRISQNS